MRHLYWCRINCMMLNLPILPVRLVISALGVSVVCDSTGTKHSYESLCGVSTRDVLFPVHLHYSQGVSTPILYNQRVGLSTASNYMRLGPLVKHRTSHQINCSQWLVHQCVNVNSWAWKYCGGFGMEVPCLFWWAGCLCEWMNMASVLECCD